MSKRIKYIIILLFLIFIFGTSCSRKPEHFNRIYTEENIIKDTGLKNSSSQENDVFEVYYFSLPKLEKGELGGLTVYGDKIYYIVQILKEYSNVKEVSNIYEYDTITDKIELIYKIEDSEVLWVNELRADENKLYWTTLKANEDCVLESFDLKTKSVEEIHSVSFGEIYQPIVLGGNSEYLSWYEYDFAEKAYKLNYYNLKEKEILSINEDDLFFDTYDRASINEKGGLILTEESDTISFNLFNLKNRQIKRMFSLSKEVGCIFPQISNNYIVWEENHSRQGIYVYSLKLNEISKIDLKELDIRIFSMHLDDNILYINTKKEIVYFDLEKNSYGIIAKTSLSKELTLDAYYCIAKISFDGQFTYLLDNHPEYHACIIKRKK